QWLSTPGYLVDGDQEIRVPQGANITLLCRYSPLQRQRVKGWYRQSPSGLVPLGRTNGWVALSHMGRLEVSDEWQKGKVQVSMVEVGATDTGEYCCASTMLFGVDIIRRFTLHVSQGMYSLLTPNSSVEEKSASPQCTTYCLLLPVYWFVETNPHTPTSRHIFPWSLSFMPKK
uniref:Ig-like domain-containing protein n=1 Tax=Paramormyrops kingsleyae TaxID=1676925 RepID=A0A3B3RN97_9TELE